MSKKVQDQLISNIPSALNNNDLIENYVEVIGEIFDEIREDINYIKYATDYAKSKTSTFDAVESNIGLDLSSFLRENVTRRIIRDMPLIYSRMGTKSSLVWVLKTLGYKSFQVDETWVPNPDLIRRGYYRGLLDVSEPERYNINQNSYTDFVVGNEYVTPQGTFFRGYEYNDFDRENEISGIPIYGEKYSTFTGLSFENMVSKTPYIVVKIYEPPVYDEVITDTDPETGQPIVLTTQQKQKVITDSIRYLIQNLQRTATTTIILVTDLLRFYDRLGFMTDMFDVVIESEPLETVEINEILSQLDNNGKIPVGNNHIEKIGSNRIIGHDYPSIATGEYTTSGVIGVTPSEIDILDDVRGQDMLTFVNNPTDGYQHVHYLDYNATLSVIVPIEANGVIVETVKNFHQSSPEDRVEIATLNSGQTFTQNIPDSHAVIFTFTTGFTGKVNISSTY